MLSRKLVITSFIAAAFGGAAVLFLGDGTPLGFIGGQSGTSNGSPSSLSLSTLWYGIPYQVNRCILGNIACQRCYTVH